MSDIAGPCADCGEWTEHPGHVFMNVRPETPEATARDLIEGRVGGEVTSEGRMCKECSKRAFERVKEILKDAPVTQKTDDGTPSASELKGWAGL